MKKSFIILASLFVCLFYSCLVQKTAKQDFYDQEQPAGDLPAVRKDTMLIDFSKDHGMHSQALSEWWYFNGHLTGPDGKKYSYVFCLFRGFSMFYFAHISFTDESSQSFTFDRIFYPSSKVKLSKQTADISYGNEQTIEQYGHSEFKIKAKLKAIRLDLVLDLEKSPLLINNKGLIDMEGGHSMYYSLTRLRTSGYIMIEGQPVPVKGRSWMDHQWGNFYVLTRGWDWFSFQMDDSTEYNLYSFRNIKGKTLNQYANILDEQNKSTYQRQIGISRMAWWHNQKTSNRYTTKWEIILPERKDTFTVTARVMNQELFATKMLDFIPSYWEGACTVVKKTANGRTIQGLGFAEHFPYRGKDRIENNKEK